MAVYQDSRYIKTAIRVRNDRAVVFHTRRRSVFNLSDATYYTFLQGDTLDVLAYRFYGSSQLWWAILDANPVYQSEIEINPGDVIVIPSHSQVVRYLG